MAKAKPRTIAPPKTKAPRFELWVNGDQHGTHDSEEEAEMHVHDLQRSGLCVVTVLIMRVSQATGHERLPRADGEKP